MTLKLKMDHQRIIKQQISLCNEHVVAIKVKIEKAEEKRDRADRENDKSKDDRYNQEIRHLSGEIDNLNEVLKELISKLPDCKLLKHIYYLN